MLLPRRDRIQEKACRCRDPGLPWAFYTRGYKHSAPPGLRRPSCPIGHRSMLVEMDACSDPVAINKFCDGKGVCCFHGATGFRRKHVVVEIPDYPGLSTPEATNIPPLRGSGGHRAQSDIGRCLSKWMPALIPSLLINSATGRGCVASMAREAANGRAGKFLVLVYSVRRRTQAVISSNCFASPINSRTSSIMRVSIASALSAGWLHTDSRRSSP